MSELSKEVSHWFSGIASTLSTKNLDVEGEREKSEDELGILFVEYEGEQGAEN